MESQGAKPNVRALLSELDYFSAHLQLEEMGWHLVDAAYEDQGEDHTLTKLIHEHDERNGLAAVVTENQALGLTFVDFYGNSTDVFHTDAARLAAVSEEALRQSARAAPAGHALQVLLLQLGVTAVTCNAPWKQAFIEQHIRQGPTEMRLAALLAATLAVNPAYLPALQEAAQDADPEVRAYSADLLRVLSGSGQEDALGTDAGDTLEPQGVSAERRRTLIEAALTAPVEDAADWVNPLGAVERPAERWQRPERRVLVRDSGWSVRQSLHLAGWTAVDTEDAQEGNEVGSARSVYVDPGGSQVRVEVIETLGLTFVDLYGHDQAEMTRAAELLGSAYTEDELREAAERATGAELNEVLLELGVTAATLNPAWKRSFIEGHMQFAPALQRKAAMLGATLSLDPVFLPAIEDAAEDDSEDADDVDVQRFARALLEVWAVRRPV